MQCFRLIRVKFFLFFGNLLPFQSPLTKKINRQTLSCSAIRELNDHLTCFLHFPGAPSERQAHDFRASSAAAHRLCHSYKQNRRSSQESCSFDFPPFFFGCCRHYSRKVLFCGALFLKCKKKCSKRNFYTLDRVYSTVL